MGGVRRVAGMGGSGAAGTDYIPALAGFVPMGKGTSWVALGGRAWVKDVTSKDSSKEDRGGARIHNETSGVADALYKDDARCLDAVREYLSCLL